MSDVIVMGGGLAGMSTAAALASAGYEVSLFESKPFLGGRATSFPFSSGHGAAEHIDNCQHILLRCCINLLDFYRRLGVENRIQFYRRFQFIEPGGRISVLEAGALPPPFHFASSFFHLHFLTLAEKAAVIRGLVAIRRGNHRDLDRITMLDWLRAKRQPQRTVDRFWRQVLISAVNEELDRMAASFGIQVFQLGFLKDARSSEMGIPSVPLAELYGAVSWDRLPNVRVHLGCPVEGIVSNTDFVSGIIAGSTKRSADFYVCALPLERAAAMAPELELPVGQFQYSPITAIHIWFDRPVTDLPHAALLDRTIQWLFNKSGGSYLQLVVSASRGLLHKTRSEVITLALQELEEFLPSVRHATVLKAHVIKEARATFSASPGLGVFRPPAQTRFRNFFLAGDWTQSGWPATMEGAVRSGYMAAEAVTRAAGGPVKFLLPDPD